MSIEVSAQEFLFSPPRGSTRNNLDEFKRLCALEEAGPDLEPAWTKVPFSHNHLHDLESLWWVTAWVAFHNDFFPKGKKSLITLEDAKKQLGLAQTLFPPVSGMSTRQNGFQNTVMFQKAYQQLGPEKGGICLCLSLTRQDLIDHYRTIEANLPESVDPEKSDNDIYDTFADIFSDLADESKGLELKPIAVIHNQLLRGR